LEGPDFALAVDLKVSLRNLELGKVVAAAVASHSDQLAETLELGTVGIDHFEVAVVAVVGAFVEEPHLMAGGIDPASARLIGDLGSGDHRLDPELG
jgi:hypothetical protein